MSMEKKKIEQFFRLLDGISEREWETLKHLAVRFTPSKMLTDRLNGK